VILYIVLTAYEVSGLDLRETEIIVMSACASDWERSLREKAHLASKEHFESPGHKHWS